MRSLRSPVNSTRHPELRSKPRWATPRRLERPTHGPIVAGVGKILGWEFYDWQNAAVDVGMEYYAETRFPCYRTVGLSAARQNGKTVIMCSRIATTLIMPRRTVAYTAQDRGIARLKWLEHVELLMSTPFASKVAYVERSHQMEMLTMRNGSRYMPVTPSKKAARSLSLDLAVIDEAWAHESMDVIGAVQGTMAARPHAQIWILSNAGLAKSRLFRHYTDLGRLEVDNPASSYCWIEYAAAEDADKYDHQAWIDANPSLDVPHGVTSIALSDAALTMDDDVFRREHLNLWITDDTSTGIDKVTWAACRDDELVPGARVAFSLDFTPERDRGSLVAAGIVGEVTPIEVIQSDSDLEGLITKTIEVARRWRAPVIIDRGGPAASTIPKLEKAKVRVRMIPINELKQACGDFYDAAHGREATDEKPARGPQLSHRGDYRLTDAVASASKRQVGDAWVWRRRAQADISPLMAATMARWGVLTTPALPKPLLVSTSGRTTTPQARQTSSDGA